MSVLRQHGEAINSITHEEKQMTYITLGKLAKAAPTLLLSAGLMFTNPAVATTETAHVAKDQAHCVTGKTSWDGRRADCYVHLELKAPSAYGFDENSIKLISLGSAGTGHGCAGLTLHRKRVNRTRSIIVRITAHGNARSPRTSGILAPIAGGIVAGIPGAIIANEGYRHVKGTGAVECHLQGKYYKDS